MLPFLERVMLRIGMSSVDFFAVCFSVLEAVGHTYVTTYRFCTFRIEDADALSKEEVYILPADA